MTEKTPVSQLQEYLVSKKKVPIYEVIEQSGPSHDPKFTVRVKVDETEKVAEAKSKQSAKHMAAVKMLQSLMSQESRKESNNNNNNNNNSPIKFFLNDSKFDHVGALKDLCLNMNYRLPKYELEEESGPSHNKVFRMKCTVSTLRSYGVSTTKKLAKQEAAMNMKTKLSKLTKDSTQENFVVIKRYDELDKKALEKYTSIMTPSAEIDENPSSLYSTYYKAYFDLKSKSSTLAGIHNKNINIDYLNSARILEEVAKELGVDIKTTNLPMDSDQYLIGKTLSVRPTASGIGINDADASYNLLKSLEILISE